jgi:hypothetical protein
MADALQEQGFRVSYTSRGHLRVEKLDEQKTAATGREHWRCVAVFAGTGGRGRGDMNSMADLRRAGFVWSRR